MLGSVGLVIGLNGLRGGFQPKWFCGLRERIQWQSGNVFKDAGDSLLLAVMFTGWHG